MVLGFRRRPGASQSEPAQPGEVIPEYFDSHLLAMLFERHPESHRLRVLDVGPIASETVSFLSQFRCHLHCADLYDEPELLAPCEPDQQAERTERLRAVLGMPMEEPYDICLFWDLLRYIDASALQALGQALAPAVDRQTLAHAFLFHGRIQPGQKALIARCFGIQTANRASQRACRHPHLVACNLPQREVMEQLGCFEVDKSRLLQGGLLEVVLQARDAS